MARFLAIYTMQPEDLARFRAMSKADQDAVDAEGLKKWEEWEKGQSTKFADPGGMVGKTLRVSTSGTAPATNAICGYVVVEAESIEDAARIFENHPHFTIFPGDGIDIMPLLT